MAMMSESQQQRYAAQIERSLPMRLEVWRNTAAGEIEPGYPAEPDYGDAPILSDVPCYAYNRMGIGTGEGSRVEREFIASDWSIHVPLPDPDAEVVITEQDQLRNITLHGRVIVAGPLNITYIATSATHRRIAAAEVR